MADADALIHVAGVNRGPDDEVEIGNRMLAEAVAGALSPGASIRRIVFANSIQTGNGTPYGTGKHAAAKILESAAEQVGADFVDVQLPNLFGEHGRPNYNSFVATFVHAVLEGETPAVTDRAIGLLHVQNAAECLLEALATKERALTPPATETSVRDVWTKLVDFKETTWPAGFLRLRARST